MTLGQRIQELRKGAGLSQEGLGEKLGVSRQAVSKWESDGGIPELDTLIAMSKLFGVTIGQLLGVEEPEQTGDAAEAGKKEAPLTEEQVEAILRRYAEESQQHPQIGMYGKCGWKAPVIALAGLAALVVFFGVQMGHMRNTISNLQWQLSSVQSNLSDVSGQVSSISGDLREQVRQVLEEENHLISTCEYEVVGMDAAAQTITVRFDATLKDYPAGSKMQFLTDWIKTDQTKGQTASDWVDGPDFSGEITIPMNFHTELTIRVEDGNGNVREQLVDYIYTFHPESFELFSDNIIGPAGISNSKGVVKQVEPMYIYSGCPELFWPVYASLELEWQSTVVQEPARTASMELELTAWDSGQWRAVQAEGKTTVYEISTGSVVTATLTVTDNLGRVFTLTESGTVSRDGKWIVTAETPPISN